MYGFNMSLRTTLLALGKCSRFRWQSDLRRQRLPLYLNAVRDFQTCISTAPLNRLTACVTNSKLIFASTYGRGRNDLALCLLAPYHRTTLLSSSPLITENQEWHLDCADSETKEILLRDMLIVYDFISEDEEQCLLDEVEPYLKRLRYEHSHWDDAIHGYRETERRKWTEKNTKIIQRIRDIAFPASVSQLAFVHVLDLSKEGYIKPHVDAIRFCGDTIAGVSLMSSSVMRLASTADPSKYGDFHLKQRSLYIMRNDARYKFTHEILSEKDSLFKGELVPRDRRISIMCRNNP